MKFTSIFFTASASIFMVYHKDTYKYLLFCILICSIFAADFQ